MTIVMTTEQKQISNLECKYMKILEKTFMSSLFKQKLKEIEKRVNQEYFFVRENYNKKNKIDIAIERLIRYFIYLKSGINITDIYLSPISCDMAIETEDCILNIDSKTIDSISNQSDIKYLHFESNQSSFKHARYGTQQFFTGVCVKANLPSIDIHTNKPILTFFLKIIYSDNGTSFKFYEDGNNIFLTCLPNGKLSNLFPQNIIFNFKTYNYSSDDKYFICSKNMASNMQINFGRTYKDKNLKEFESYLKKVNFTIPFLNYNLGLLNGRPLIITDPNNAYVPVGRKDGWYLERIISGQTTRIEYTSLAYRINGSNEFWLGHIEDKI